MTPERAGNSAAAASPARPAPTSAEVRERIEEALRLDLVGPASTAAPDLAGELLPRRIRPSNWYLTGFLVPDRTPPDERADADEDDDSTGEVGEGAGLTEESADERRAAKRGFFPSSIGLSFLVPEAARELEVTVSWGDYAAEDIPPAKPGGEARQVWRRTPRREQLALALGPTKDEPMPVPDADGLELHRVERALAPEGVGAAASDARRAVSLFLVNRRTPAPDRSTDAFQTAIEVRCNAGFLGRPATRGGRAGDWDEEVADLHYRDALAFATGHGVSADWDVLDGDCRVVRTAWIPRAEVERIETVDLPGVELSMAALGGTETGNQARDRLGPLVSRYRDWIAARRSELDALPPEQRETAEELLRLAGVAATRMERGIAVLAEDAEALDAFRMANLAVLLALRQRAGVEDPKWRAFQLAFLLLNLAGLADPADPDREIVELLFFPTGGGKTEAYLGLAAFAMVLRRLRHPGAGCRAGAGVSVIMRYTLRLLTFDQLGRAAALVCALDLLREQNPARYGEWPFEIGLWVGKGATANQMGRLGRPQPGTARARVSAFQQDSQREPSPIPLRNCPWCDREFTPESFVLTPDADNPTDLRIVCLAEDCPFGGERGLPIVAVDEPLYRRLPAFLVATVDKFASLPWVGASGALLGGADRYSAAGFSRGTAGGGGERLPAPLPPPDLIVQDELHLIAGPLGTMAGLYEAAIEALVVRAEGKQARYPKIVASTATASRAPEQIQALFGRATTQCFPPPGPDRRDSFFARQLPAADAPARRYLGIAAPGRNPKKVMRQVLLPLMAAAHHEFVAAGGRKNPSNPADPYLTTIGYFNALRELGGARRILEEEVQSELSTYGTRRRIGEPARRFRDRKYLSDVLELTSRIPTDEVARTRERLNRSFSEKQAVDWVLATNMISVGLDVQRLGLMVVVGQPKMNAEYIQATSRVGRDRAKPGLVLTLLNMHKPRDRSHYERFRHFHETFYRAVEPGSITPFAAQALDRGFAGAFVTLARHGVARLTPPAGAGAIAGVWDAVDEAARRAFLGRVEHQLYEDEDELRERLRSVENRIGELLDAWRKIAEEVAGKGVNLFYQRYEGAGGKSPGQRLLRDLLDRKFDPAETRKFRAGRSLRDVEPEVRLRVPEGGAASTGTTP